MKDVVELRLRECTISFRIRDRKDGYVRFDIEARFQSLSASLPPVERGSLSKSDLERLCGYADASLQEPRSSEIASFAAYDAFFTLEFLEDDSVRVMLQYGPKHPLALGVEGTISEENVVLFRDGWRQQITG